MCGHCLFQDANSFPRAKLEENPVILEEQIKSKDKCMSISKWRLLYSYPSNMCATRGKNVYEVYEVTSLLLEIFPFPCSLV